MTEEEILAAADRIQKERRINRELTEKEKAREKERQARIKYNEELVKRYEAIKDRTYHIDDIIEIQEEDVEWSPGYINHYHLWGLEQLIEEIGEGQGLSITFTILPPNLKKVDF
jgi:hypothetical protein